MEVLLAIWIFPCVEEEAAYAADHSLTLASSLDLERAQTLWLSVMQVPDGCCLTKVCLHLFLPSAVAAAQGVPLIVCACMGHASK